MRRPTPLEVSRDPREFLREVRANVQRGYRHLVGASRLRAAVRDVWLLAEALAFATKQPEMEDATPLSAEESEIAEEMAAEGAPAFPKPVRPPKKRSGLGLRSPNSDNPAYLDAVKGLGYCCIGRYFNREHECRGPIDPCHAGRRPGIGLKAPDDTAIPGCRWHHRALDRHYGPFVGMGAAELLRFRDRMIAETRAVVLPLLEAA